MQSDRMSLGSEIRRLREDKGLTLRDVEDATGISQSTLRNIEADRKVPSYLKVDALAAVLGTEVFAAAYPQLVKMLRPTRREPLASGPRRAKGPYQRVLVSA